MSRLESPETDGGEEGPGLQLLRTKVIPPTLAVGSVHRRRLLDSLASSPDAPLSVIVAPAGFGKTTLAIQHVADLDGPAGWVSLEPGDNDPVRFWSYFALACGIGDAAAIERSLRDGPDGIDAALTTIRAEIELSEQEVVVVLDEYHHITNDSIHSQLGNLLRHPPRLLRVVIASRAEVPLPIGRLRIEGNLNEVRADQLAFAVDETERLLTETLQLEIAEPAIAEYVTDRTEGWAAGVHLAGLSLRADPGDTRLDDFRGDHRHLAEYLATEVLSTQTTEVQTFLLETSVLTHLQPNLCDAATGRTDSAATLSALAAGNVFTTVVDLDGPTFRYHPLFREHLRQRLLITRPDRAREINRAAARWHLERHHADLGITHAIAADDHEWARRLILESFIAYSNSGRWVTVQRWIAAYGEQNAAAYADLCLMIAWGHLTLGAFDDVEPWLEAAQLAAPPDDHAISTQIVVDAGSIRSHRARHQGDVDAALAHARRAVNALDKRNDHTSTAAYAALGAALYWCPASGGVVDALTEAVRRGHETNESSSIVVGHSYLALIAAGDGEIDRAHEHCDAALAYVADDDQRRFHRPAIAYIARAVAHIDGGHLIEAEAALDTALPIAVAGHEPLQVLLVELQRGRLHHLRGSRELTLASLAAARDTLDPLPSAGALDDLVRSVENETRFAPRDDRNLPLGARELTEREHSILALLPRKLTRRELGRQLHISENTVKTHLTSIRHKLGISGRADIVHRARELGLIDPDT